MSQWTYVALGWISTYLAVGIWVYSSRPPKQSGSENNK